jgi:GNAT superfamily N-acetyltransferase
MKIEIHPLADHPGLHDLVAGWHWSQWGTPLNRGLYGSLVSHCMRDAIPVIYLAFADGDPAGTVGLLRTDLLSRQDLTPWMAVLYVLPEYRGSGIASVLQEHALAEARRLGYGEIYLYTKLSGFYEKTGWEYSEHDVDDHGESIRIYRKNLKYPRDPDPL